MASHIPRQRLRSETQDTYVPHDAMKNQHPIRLSAAHLQAVDRVRRLVLQEDANMPFEAFQLPLDQWLDFRFRHCDAPGCQVDSIWWDIGIAEDTYALHDSQLLPRLRLDGFDDWVAQGRDWVAELVAGCHSRGLEAFWSNRVCPVDFPQPLKPGATDPVPHDHPSRRNPIKAAHPEWTVPCWWPQGLWNLAVAEVRQRKVAILREIFSRYQLDGLQLDFARHTPCLPPGREWELRAQVTQFVRQVRSMLLEIEAATRQPRLLAVRVGETLEGNHLDGLEVERWISEELVDIVVPGGRTTTVDLAGFRAVIGSRPIKLCAGFDGHHTTDGYYFPPIEYLRGVFRNFRLQGADFLSLFNWSCAEPEAYDQFGLPPQMKCASHSQAMFEAGQLESLRGDLLYAAERRGGYPWAGNFVYRNEERPLPAWLSPEEALELPVRIEDRITSPARLRLILRNADVSAAVDATVNGSSVREVERDPTWKDGQLYGDAPQPSAGSASFYAREDPNQRLLRLDYAVEPSSLVAGDNKVSVRAKSGPGLMAVEKVEISVSQEQIAA
jgi:hypothetical protein